jgi:hypothetical protein
MQFRTRVAGPAVSEDLQRLMTIWPLVQPGRAMVTAVGAAIIFIRGETALRAARHGGSSP